MPVTDAVKRGIKLAKKALEEQGYQVVDVDITPEEFTRGRNTLLGYVSTGSIPGLLRDWRKSGETLPMGVWMNAFLFNRGPVARWFLVRLLRAAGLGRLASSFDYIREMNAEEFEDFHRLRY